MERLCIDASVFLSALLETDVEHESSQRFFDALSQQPDTSVRVPATVAFEVVNVLLKFRQRAAARAFLDRLSWSDLMAIDDDFLKASPPFLSGISLKSADAIVAVAAALERATLITLDRQLLREASQITVAMTPAAWATGS